MSHQIARATSEDLHTIETSKSSVRHLTASETAVLRALQIPPKLDFSKYVTLIRNQGPGGCGTMTSLIILDILKEREQLCSPDFSYGFAEHLYNDPKSQAYGKQLKLLQVYGCCPEALFPTNYDRGPSPAPTLEQLNAARAYRIKAFGDAIDYDHGLSVDLIKQYLVKYGPVWAEGALEYAPSLPTPWDYHVFAIIGFDDDASEFTILTSYGDQWAQSGYIKCPYGNINAKGYKHVIPSVSRIRWIENLVTPLAHPITGRVRIKTEHGRHNLTVRVAFGSQPVMTIWDRNNSYLGLGPDNNPVMNVGQVFDDSKDLVLDFPVRPPRAQCWPPSAANEWHLEVTDHQSPTSGAAGVVQEFALVERHPAAGRAPIIHRASAQVPFSSGTTVRLNLPTIRTYRLTLAAAATNIPTQTQDRLYGRLICKNDVATTVNPETPVPNREVHIHRVSNDPVEQARLQEQVGTARTDRAGNFSLIVTPATTADYQALVAETDGTMLAVSNIVHLAVR